MSTTSRSIALFIASMLVLPYAAVPLQVYSAPTQGFTIAVTDGRSVINAGGTVIYAVTVSLYGPNSETSTVEFGVPDYATIVSPSNGGQLRGDKVVWTNLTMSPNSSITMTVQVTLVPGVPDGTVLTATAAVDGIQSTDKTTVGTSVIPYTAFKLSITDGLKTVTPTQDVTYTATVKNVSADKVTTDVLVSLGNFVVVSDVDPDASVSGGSVTWRGVTLEPGASETYSIDGKIDRGAAEFFLITTKLQAGGAMVSDTTSVQTNASDLMAKRDDDEEEVENNAKIRFSVTPDAQEVLPGGRIRYTVSVRNADTEKVDGLTATVKFDPSIALLLGLGTAEKVNASTLKWNVPALSAGETWRTSFELALAEGLPMGTSIPVISTLQGSSIDSITLQSRVSVTSVALIGNLPATGYPLDTLATFMLLPFALLSAGIQRKLRYI